MLEITLFYTAATVALIATVMAMTRANAIHALQDQPTLTTTVLSVCNRRAAWVLSWSTVG